MDQEDRRGDHVEVGQEEDRVEDQERSMLGVIILCKGSQRALLQPNVETAKGLNDVKVQRYFGVYHWCITGVSLVYYQIYGKCVRKHCVL